MATLQTIRNRAGLLVSIAIGVSLLAFILSDLITNNKLFNSGSKTDVAEIYGEGIPVKLFEQKVEELTENYKRNSGKETTPDEEIMQSIREQAWEEIVTDYVLINGFTENGIVVENNELQDMVVGNNIDPQILQIPIFKDKNTGQFDPNLVKQFIANMDKDETGNARLSWIAFEKQLQRSRMLNKYYTLVKKGMYITKDEAKKYSDESSENINIKYVVKKFGDISDSTISVKPEEIEKYYNEHKYLFEQEASRDIEYIVFDVKPSQADIDNIKTKLDNLKNELDTTTNLTDFVNHNSDSPYLEQYISKSSLTSPYDSIFFNAKPGFIYGPYIENEVYKLAKIVSFKEMPDSISASHILISPNEKRTKEQAKILSDSIKNVLDKGGDFAALAMQYSDDKGSSSKGGDLSWFKPGMMVKPFEEAAFGAKKNEIVTAETQFGYHIIKVTDASSSSNKAQIAFIEWKIEPSTETYQTVKTKVYQFAGYNTTKDKFNAAITKENINKRVANNLRPNDKNIAGIESPREIIRWAFKEETKKDEISQPFEFTDKFVIAELTEIREKGTAEMNQIKDQLTTLVKKEKKADKFISEMKPQVALGSIDLIAQKLNVTAADAPNINFNSFSLPGMGIEPNVIAASTCYDRNKISPPIKGNNGVFIISVVDKIKAPQPLDVKTAKLQLSGEVQSRVDYQAFEALKKVADVKDYRYFWY